MKNGNLRNIFGLGKSLKKDHEELEKQGEWIQELPRDIEKFE